MSTLLVCMAETQVRDTAVEWLEDEGYALTTVAAIDAAVVEVKDGDFTVLLFDLRLDDSTTLDGLRRLRAATQAPLLVLGESDCDERPLRALDLGADDYVCRTPDDTIPLARKELTTRLSVALRNAQGSPDVVPDGELIAGPIRVQQNTRQVEVNGEPIALTPNEFRLLVCLVAEPDRVFTHAELLTRIWGPHAVDRVNYLHTYMDRLRKRIELDPSTPRRLQSVRGVGYRLCLDEG